MSFIFSLDGPSVSFLSFFHGHCTSMDKECISGEMGPGTADPRPWKELE